MENGTTRSGRTTANVYFILSQSLSSVGFIIKRLHKLPPHKPCNSTVAMRSIPRIHHPAAVDPLEAFRGASYLSTCESEGAINSPALTIGSQAPTQNQDKESHTGP